MATETQKKVRPNGKTDQSPKERWRPRVKKLADWVVFLGAVAALVVGVGLLWDIWQGKPVAAAFTRVGGATRVETAVEASRLWLTPPQHVVMTPVGASQQTMLGAARCAMGYDAPLLFTSQNPRRQRLVDATMAGWRKTERGSARREVINNQLDVARCLANANPANVNRWPALALDQSLWLSRVTGPATLIFERHAGPVSPAAFPSRARRAPVVVLPDGEMLAPTVVFAAARAPEDPPDVAVGLALAAHMAAVDRPVSLLAVPRYLEANPQLEDQLRNQRQVVERGVVLGWPRVLPEDTRTLLRQLLTATDRQGALGEIRNNLGSVGTLVAALLVLLGVGVAGQKAPEIADPVVNLWTRVGNGSKKLGHQAIEGVKQLGSKIMKILNRNGHEPATPTRADWLAALGTNKKAVVTVWLCNGWKVTGIVSGSSDGGQSQDRAHALPVSILRLDEVRLVKVSGDGSSLQEGVKSVMVQVKDIELIDIESQGATSAVEPPESSHQKTEVTAKRGRITWIPSMWGPPRKLVR